MASPVPLLLHETQGALSEAKTRLSTLRSGLFEATKNLEKTSDAVDDYRLLVSKYREVYLDLIREDIVSLPEVIKVKNVHERNLDMFVQVQLEKTQLTSYLRSLEHAIKKEESLISELDIERATWNKILTFPCQPPKPSTPPF